MAYRLLEPDADPKSLGQEIIEKLSTAIRAMGRDDIGLVLIAPPSELISLELSQAFAQAIEAGLISPIGRYKDDKLTFAIDFCPQHQMVLLPTCPGCEGGENQ